MLIALTIIGFCCAGIVSVLNARHGPPSALPLVLAIMGAPLGWLTLHTIAAFHYARLYYAAGCGSGPAIPRIASSPASGIFSIIPSWSA